MSVDKGKGQSGGWEVNASLARTWCHTTLLVLFRPRIFFWLCPAQPVSHPPKALLHPWFSVEICIWLYIVVRYFFHLFDTLSFIPIVAMASTEAQGGSPATDGTGQAINTGFPFFSTYSVASRFSFDNFSFLFSHWTIIGVIQLDPWLEPYRGAIKRRFDLVEKWIQTINETEGGLENFSRVGITVLIVESRGFTDTSREPIGVREIWLQCQSERRYHIPRVGAQCHWS